LVADEPLFDDPLPVVALLDDVLLDDPASEDPPELPLPEPLPEPLEDPAESDDEPAVELVASALVLAGEVAVEPLRLSVR